MKYINHISNIFLLLFCSIGLLVAQEPSTGGDETGFQRTTLLNKSIVLPNSPEASSLGRYGEFNTNPYTGSASISVPLHTISGKTVSVPVNLLYQGTAVKVDSREGWTGLGWSLTANYAITRNVVANPDLEFNYFSKKDELSPQTNTDLIEENQLYYDIARGCTESQPDHYYLSYPGGAAKFYISPEKENKIIYQKAHQNLTITPTYDSNNYSDIIKFSVKDDKGVTYEFSTVEETDFIVDDQFGGDIAPCMIQYPRYNSAWHLTKIIGTNGIEEFFFDYETATGVYAMDINPFYYQSKTYNPQNISSPNCCGNANESSSSGGSTNTTNIIGRKFLKEIKYVLGIDTLERMVFESTALSNFCPYAGNTDKKLDKIRCLKGDNGEVNIIDFDFTYDNPCSLNRLILEKVQEKSATDASTFKEPYEFSYNSQPLPNYISTSLDHFGYFNNKSNGNTLIPKIKLQGQSTVLNNSDADRNPSESATKAGILEQVIYPTGGYTKYNWEIHEAKGLGAGNYYDYDPTQNAEDDRAAGGLRIESIEHFDCDNSLLLKRSYKYVKDGTYPANQSSSGIMLNEPTYTVSALYNNCPIPLLGQGNTCNTNYTCERTTISASSRSTLGTVKGSHIGYSRVEEIIEANDNSGQTSGKTVYFFKNQKLSPFGLKDDVENGLMTKKEIYDADGNILDESTYIYSTEENETRKDPVFFGFRVVPKQTQDNKNHLCKNASGQYDWYPEQQTSGCVEEAYFQTKFERQFTEHKQRWVYQSEMTNTRYFYDENDNLTGQISTTTDYIYNDTTTNQPTETLVTNSDGKVYKTTTHFVNSFDDTEYPVTTTPNGFVRSMQLKGMTSFPLVQAQYIDNQLVYKTKLDYQQFSGKTLPHKLYESFPTKTDVLSEVFDSYDGVANITQGHRHFENSNNEVNPIALLYNKERSRVIAQAKNAEVGEIAYTSFEENEASQGGWTIPLLDRIDFFSTGARTGNYAYQTSSGSPVTTSTRAGKYIISYYTDNVNAVSVSGSNVTELNKKVSPADAQNWYYVTHTINTTSLTTINLSFSNNTSYIDELRLYPYDALMNTYVYDNDTRLPTSIMDENSIPARFEYDGILRLTGVKNFDDHYLSLTEYEYQQSSNCTNTHNAIKNWTVLASGQLSATNAKGLGTNGVLKGFSYFDGLGRSIQSIGVAQSPTGKDIISFNEYDKFGRTVEQFLPYTETSNGGAFRGDTDSKQTTFYENQFTGEGSYGSAKTDLEFSPLNRAFKQYAPGSDFASNPAEIKYSTNSATDVRNFYQMTNPWYAANSLSKTIQSDENGNTVILYTDKIGRKIMQDQEGAKTYFLYDNKGLLEQIIQPEAAEKGHTTPMLTYLDAVIKDGSFLYTYDSEYRMKTKVVPGCQAYTYYYNDLDQLVMTKNGNGFKTFTKYDRLGRPIITGRYTGTGTPNASGLVFEERSNSSPHYYTTNQSFPIDGAIDIYTVSYYDNYDFNNDNSDDISYQSTSVGNYANTDYPFVRGKSTGSKVAILKNDGASPDTYLNGSVFYDKFNRTIQSKSDNHLAGTDISWMEYNFPGWLMNSRREHTTTTNNQPNSVITNEQYTYDDIGRQLTYHHQLGDNVNDKQLVCAMSYNERGELFQKKIGNTSGSNYLQTIDYQYNIRKWLTAINDVNNSGTDLFSMNLDYIGNDENYNGNISKIEWKSQNNASKKVYEYTYDNLNRLKVSLYSETTNSSHNGRYNTTYNYDKNGNIDQLHRFGQLSDGTFGSMDFLSYTYNNEGNLVALSETQDQNSGFKSVTTNGLGTYTYDDNGNMTSDEHKDITVTYNFFNLPETVSKSDGSTIQWLYDAAGTKLQKTVVATNLKINDNPILSKEYKASQIITSTGTIISGSNVIFTAGQRIELNDGFNSDDHFIGQIQSNTATEVRDYLGGIEYVNNSIEVVYFSGGRIKYESNNTDYQYVLSDYQGNSRVLFKDNGGVAEVVEDYSGYYPFGALHGQESELSSKYLFGGKELQTELDLGWSDFGVRYFDNWSAKWQGVDILSEANSGSSPYAYTLGNPIRYSDPTGMIEEDANGLMTVSTSNWGRDVTGGENSGQVGREVFEDTRERKPKENQIDADWAEMTKRDLMGLSGDIARGVARDYPNKSSKKRNMLVLQEMGRRLEGALIESASLTKNTRKFGPNNRIPDAILVDAVYVDAIITEFIEIKSGKNISINGQILDYLSYLSTSTEKIAGLPQVLHVVHLQDAVIDWGTLESRANLAGVGLYSSVVEMQVSNNSNVRIGGINRRILPQYNSWKYIFLYGRFFDFRGGGSIINTSPMQIP